METFFLMQRQETEMLYRYKMQNVNFDKVQPLSVLF